MENKGFFYKNFLRISHLPTICLLVGYLIYWLELYLFNNRTGKSTVLATVLFLSVAVITIIRKRSSVILFCNWLKTMLTQQGRFIKYWIFISCAVVAVIIAVVFYASLLPPHLTQEFDALNYHYTLPRQHLILASFKHLEWSSADLFTSPIDFALAPYWFATELPNKFPQFLFLIGLVLVSVNLVKHFSNSNFTCMVLIVFAIFSSHFIGIQMGTAMLDIAICYLFLAALDSFLGGAILLSAVEFTFFLWSKPFIPFQIFSIVIAMLLIKILLKKIGFKDDKWGFVEIINPYVKRKYIENLKRMLVPVILLSIIIGGPFLIKSLYYSGTPLFPFAPGLFDINKSINKNSDAWNSILASSRALINAKDSYGYGRSPIDFMRHLWLIAVPERGVNNKYDYPVGLTYLLFLGPFFYMTFYSMKKRQFSILPLFIIVYWLCWWFGSQQTRFLYIPILLMMIYVSSELKMQSRVFVFAITISLILTGTSIFRAHKNDFGLSGKEVLRGRDKEIMQMNQLYLGSKSSDKVYLDYYDVAYARFPVIVKKADSAWVLQIDK